MRRRWRRWRFVRRLRAERYLWGTAVPYRGWGTVVVGFDPAGLGACELFIVVPTGYVRLPR